MKKAVLLLSELIYEMNNKGFYKIAIEINEVVDNLIDIDEDEEKLNVSSIINSIGLVGDVKPETPMQNGFIFDPFFSEKGEPQY